MHTINWITNYSKNTLWRSRSFILTLFQVLKVGYVIKYCVWWWCFILTLNRALKVGYVIKYCVCQWCFILTLNRALEVGYVIKYCVWQWCFILTLFQVLKVGYVIKYCVWWWCFILTLNRALEDGYVIKYCVWQWCFILTLNRASALSGSKYEQNYLLLSESRCNRRKNRFRVKTKRVLQLCQDRNTNKITCCYLNLVAIEERIGLELKQNNTNRNG